MRTESPYAEALARAIRSEIEQGSISIGRPLPPERELAERFQVSRSMIRKTVSILAKEGWLVVQPHCRPVVAMKIAPPVELEVATKRDHISVWLWPYVDDYAVSSIFRGIQKGAHGAGLRLMVATADHGRWEDVLESERRFLHEVAEDPSCAGAIVWLLGGARSLRSLREAEDRQVPVVFIDRKPPAPFESDFVGTDNEAAAMKAVQHLIGLGHRRIACLINLDEVSTVAERIRGYRRAMDESGLGYQPDLLVQPYQDQNETEASALDRYVAGAMERPDAPTAFFTVNDSIGLQLVECLEKAGFSVPGDVSVVGFDGLLRSIPGGGRLTTVDQDFFRMGELAAALLKERIVGGTSRTYRHVLLDAPLRVEGTTAPPRIDTDHGLPAVLSEELAS